MGRHVREASTRHQKALSPTEFLRGPGRSFVLDLGLSNKLHSARGPAGLFYTDSSSLRDACPHAHPSSMRCELKHYALLIEDDSAVANSIELMLKSAGLNLYKTDLGEEGIDLGKIYDYDIIVLDLSLPDMSGFEVLRKLRASKVGSPILILSGLDNVEDKIKGLGFGADDYMTKPFHKDELVARIKALVRRSKGHAQSAIHVDDLRLDLDSKAVEIDGTRVHLTDKEYKILELLALHKHATLAKESFLNQLYGGIDEPDSKIIDVFICKLRKKLSNASGGKDYIETVWGRGYTLRGPSDGNDARLTAS